MGTSINASQSIADALFTRTQQRVLATLFGHPERSFYANEIIRLAGVGSGAVQRELRSLVASGLAMLERQGNQVHYRANPDSPIFGELCSLVVKTFGVADQLRQALMPLAARIAFASLYGSQAKGAAHAASDVDVLVVADGLTLEALLRALAPVELALQRKVSPTLYTASEFARRREARNGFVSKVLAGTIVSLIGGLDGSS